MPRYELRNTTGDALTYAEGTLPLDLMKSQAAGTYRAKAMSAEEATDIVVPALTASITEASLTVGDTATLTTNAPDNATYQWELDGTPIGGATASSYVTAAAGALTCVVSIPGNPQAPVETAAVTVAAAAGLTLTYLGEDSITATGASYTFAGKTLGTGKIVAVATIQEASSAAFSAVSFAGNAGTLVTDGVTNASITSTNTAVRIYEYESAVASGDIVVTLTGGNALFCSVRWYLLTGATSITKVKTAILIPATAPWQANLDLDVAAGGCVIAGLQTSSGPGDTPDFDTFTGITQDGTIRVRADSAGVRSVGGSASGLTAATPRTVRIGDVGTNTSQAASVAVSYA